MTTIAPASSTNSTQRSLRERLDGLESLARLRDRPVGAVSGVPTGAVALLAWWLRGATGRSVIVVSPDPEPLYGDALVWTGGGDVGLFVAPDTPPFDRVPPSEEVTRRRLAALALLGGSVPALIVASPAGLLRPTLPVDLIRAEAPHLARGDTAPLAPFLARLVALGYRRVTAVSSPGDFAVRGGIVDVFGLDRARPWRAEWFGDEIEDIRAFDVESQTSVARLSRVSVWPARELDLRSATVARAREHVAALDLNTCRDEVRDAWARDLGHLEAGAYDEGMDLFSPYLIGDPPPTLLDHAEGCLIVYAGGRERSLRAADRHLAEVEGLRAQEEARSELPAGARTGLITAAEFTRRLDASNWVEVLRESEAGDALDLGWGGSESYAGRFEAFLEAMQKRRGERATIVLSRQQQRLEELLTERNVTATDLEEFDATTSLTDGTLGFAAADLSAGFVIAEAGIEVYSDHEVFGIAKRRGSPLARGARRAESTSARGARTASSGNAAREAFVIQFAPGDLVVHRDHGIGRFLDMRRVTDDGGEHEYMTIEYAEGNRLFVPVAHLDRVDRYIGGGDGSPALSRLGTSEWDRAKKRVKERTEDVARELIALYSRREMAQGHAYSPDGVWQREMEASFAFEETPDQKLVLDEIKRDMEASKPMDRVVCGDVGFGKTELALRAAFKAASEGRQVAMLVPTTILSQQHFRTFTDRLRAFPITVGQLSRFCTDEQLRSTLMGLKTGGVDVVIGTHRLLQKDVVFRNLGLVIIDEEQRFGVMQKERFKELRVAVDVLSLSATPIPRTLHMSLAGVRDLSVIQTPPEERQPIKTYVTAREPGLIREVVTRELMRGGQVYYLHNRVQTIEKEAAALRELLPEARIAVGHGQMSETLLSDVMRAFSDAEVDVLVCSTIIESGLDIPNANTIIINDAHRLGLAQLYQLRGRVGRAGQRAYAYFMYPPARALTEKADRRLEVISDLQDLGSGFKLAMRDLEIRGAGNLLGEAQSGEIATVGLELYNHLLGQAVASMQGKPIVESPMQVTVSLPLPAFLPPAYVADEKLRLRCYQDLAGCVSEAELEAKAKAMIDRFGALPDPAEALIYSLRVRLLAAAGGVQSVESDRGRLTVQLPSHHGLDLEVVVRQFRTWLASTPTRLLLASPTGRLEGPEWREVLVRSLRELGRLARLRQQVPA